MPGPFLPEIRIMSFNSLPKGGGRCATASCCRSTRTRRCSPRSGPPRAVTAAQERSGRRACETPARVCGEAAPSCPWRVVSSAQPGAAWPMRSRWPAPTRPRPRRRNGNRTATARAPADRCADHPNRCGRLPRRSWPRSRSDRRIAHANRFTACLPSAPGRALRWLSGSAVSDPAAQDHGTGGCQLAEVAAGVGVVDDRISGCAFAQPGYPQVRARSPGTCSDG